MTKQMYVAIQRLCENVEISYGVRKKKFNEQFFYSRGFDAELVNENLWHTLEYLLPHCITLDNWCYHDTDKEIGWTEATDLCKELFSKLELFIGNAIVDRSFFLRDFLKSIDLEKTTRDDVDDALRVLTDAELFIREKSGVWEDRKETGELEDLIREIVKKEAGKLKPNYIDKFCRCFKEAIRLLLDRLEDPVNDLICYFVQSGQDKDFLKTHKIDPMEYLENAKKFGEENNFTAIVEESFDEFLSDKFLKGATFY